MDSRQVRNSRKFNRRSWGPMLMELLVSVLIFALVSSVAVAFFARASAESWDSRRISWSADQVDNLGELFRSSGSAEEFREILSAQYPEASVTEAGTGSGDAPDASFGAVMYYDKDFKALSRAGGRARTVVKVTVTGSGGMMTARVRIEDGKTGKKISSVRYRHYTG